MLFNSPEYIFYFLPAAIAVFFLLARFRFDLAIIWTALASCVFYAYWDVRYVLLLLASTLCNFLVGRKIEQAPGLSRSWMLFGVSANLALLIVFKYADFFLRIFSDVADIQIEPIGLVLPLGISFFTFTQIAYLVDLSRGFSGRYDFWRYLLFVSFFPHLLAGPILHHQRMMPQFTRRLTSPRYLYHVSYGVLLFSMGLFKKLCLADVAAPYANAAFAAAEKGVALSTMAAWWGVLCTLFSWYFDFSGYSDMAVGSARFMGIRLPFNFSAPYSALNVIDFWRRWHMSLSRFLRDYLYVPLGGNRAGTARRYSNVMTTMVLGGLWHGAGYGFLVWGALHGSYIVLNHAWRGLRKRLPLPPSHLENGLAWLITFLAVTIGWVFFRAPTLWGAHQMLAAMSGANGSGVEELVALMTEAGRRFAMSEVATLALALFDLETLPLPSHPLLGSIGGLFLLPGLLALAVIGPTSQATTVLILRNSSARGWKRSLAFVAVAVGSLMFFLCLARLNKVSEFLYFQF